MALENDNPKAAGCSVTLQDFPRVCVSLSCCCAQLGNGSTTAVLGLAIPVLATAFNVPCSAFGVLFIFSGVGYFIGVSFADQLLARYPSFSRFSGICCFSSVTAITVFSMFMVTNIWSLSALVFLQYAGIAGVDAFCTVALNEMWGQRVQPWMQSRSAFYALGGMIPPLVMQRAGSLDVAVAVCAGLCLSSVLGGSIERLGWGLTGMSAANEYVAELTPLTEAEDVTLNVRDTSEIKTHRGLSLASPVAVIPNDGKNMLSIFLFLFCTFTTTFTGWFPTYCSVKAAAGDYIQPGLEEKVVSMYFMCMSWGCLASIPLSVWLPNRTLLRFHLLLIVVGVLLLEVSLMDGIMLHPLLAASALMGYGVSSVFPLAMTMANDYGFTADAAATTRMLMGGSLGASLVPTLVGYIMKELGPDVLPAFMLIVGTTIACTYLIVHNKLSQAASNWRLDHKAQDSITELQMEARQNITTAMSESGKGGKSV